MQRSNQGAIHDSPALSNGRLKRVRNTASETQEGLTPPQNASAKRPLTNSTSRRAGGTPTQRTASTVASNSKPTYDALLEHIEIPDWVRILNDAKDCRIYKAQAEKDRRDTLASIENLRKKELELRKLKDARPLPNLSDPSLPGMNAGIQAAWNKLMGILPGNVPSFNWESAVMKEAVAEMKAELEKLDSAAEGYRAMTASPDADNNDTSMADTTT